MTWLMREWRSVNQKLSENKFSKLSLFFCRYGERELRSFYLVWTHIVDQCGRNEQFNDDSSYLHLISILISAIMVYN